MKKILFWVIIFSRCLRADVSSFFDRLSGHTCYCRDDFGSAQRAFERLLVNDPQNTNIMASLADAFYAQDKFEVAEQYYQQLLNNEVNIADQEKLLFNIGCTRAQKKEFKEALNFFEKVVVINKENIRAQKNIEILKKILEQEQKKQKEQQNNQQENKKDQKQDSENKSNNKNEKNSKQDNSKQDKEENEKQQEQQNKQSQPESNSQPNNQHEEKKTDKADNQRQSADQPQSAQPEQNKQEQQSANAANKLDKQMAQLLHDVDKLDQRGQHLYLQAIAGKSAEQQRGAHDW